MCCVRGGRVACGALPRPEIGDWTRFTGSSIGAYVGLVPTEYSSGSSRVQGSITKAGNAHVRRLLIDSAWHHRAAYRNPGPTMRARWAKVDPALKDRGHAGNRRLHQQWCRFNERKKPHVVVKGQHDRGSHHCGRNLRSPLAAGSPLVSSVSTTPGTTAVTAMPRLRYSSRSDSVMPTTACLVPQ